MKPTHKFWLLSHIILMSSSAFAVEQGIFPLMLKGDEEIILSGNTSDELLCEEDDQKYNSHLVSLTVTQKFDSKNNCHVGPKRIYADGVLVGACDDDVKLKKGEDFRHSFIDFQVLDKLKDEEVIKLFQGSQVGYCQFYGSEIRIAKHVMPSEQTKVKDIYKSYLLDNSLALKEKTNTPKVIAKTLRDLTQGGLCGKFSKADVDKYKSNGNKILGKLDIGFDMFVAEKYTGDQLAALNFPAKKLIAKFGLTIADFKKHGYDAYELYAAGIPIDQLKKEYTTAQLVSAVPIFVLSSHFTLKEFKDANVDARRLRDAKYSAKDLKEVGFNLSQLSEAGFSTTELKSNFAIKDFRAVGYKAPYLKYLGYSAKELKDDGLSLSDLMEAQYNTNDLKAIFAIKDFRAVGYKAPYLKYIGYSAKELKDDGVSLSDLMEAQYNTNDLKAIFTINDFRKVGYNASYLRYIGYSAPELKAAGVELSDLMEAKFNTSELKAIFTIKDFRKAGYNASYLRYIGYSAQEMKADGISLNALSEAGIGTNELKSIFTVKDFKNAGYSADNLRYYGYSARDLKDAGFTASAIASAGFPSREVDDLFK